MGFRKHCVWRKQNLHHEIADPDGAVGLHLVPTQINLSGCSWPSLEERDAGRLTPGLTRLVEHSGVHSRLLSGGHNDQRFGLCGPGKPS